MHKIGVGKMEEKSIKISKNVYRLKKPFEFEGNIYEEFILDFDSLKGKDLINIDEELSFLGKFIVSPETSLAFKTILVSKATKVSYDVISNLPLKEFNELIKRATGFLLDTD